MPSFLVAVAVIFRGSWWPHVNEWADRVLVATGARQVEGEETESGRGRCRGDSPRIVRAGIAQPRSDFRLHSPVELQTFRRSITIPATIVERPGQTRIQVSAPMTGVVTFVHAVQGAAIEPETLLFQIRLTHEDLVQVQTDFLRSLGELDVELLEIERLKDVTRSGAVAPIRLLEREYERDKLQALLNAQREALRLHGLSEQQVNQIAEERRLLSELQLFAPSASGSPQTELRLTGPAIQQTSFESEESEIVPNGLILQELVCAPG